jgi:hypothetical protein
MAGLYYRGQHLFDCPHRTILNISDGLDISWESDGLDAGTVQKDNWYGVFAVNDSGVVRGKLVSFVRVHNVSGTLLTCSRHFEKDNPLVYDFTSDVYLDQRYVVLTGLAAGRTGTIAGNSDRAFTLRGDTTGLFPGSWLMVAPAGFTEYCYLGSIFRDTAEPMNFYKYGNRVFGYNSRDTFRGHTTQQDWFHVDVWDKGHAPPTARVVRVVVGITYGGNDPFWFYLAADKPKPPEPPNPDYPGHALSQWLYPGQLNQMSPYYGITAEVPIEFSDGKFYVQTERETSTTYIRVVGYDE